MVDYFIILFNKQESIPLGYVPIATVAFTLEGVGYTPQIPNPSGTLTPPRYPTP